MILHFKKSGQLGFKTLKNVYFCCKISKVKSKLMNIGNNKHFRLKKNINKNNLKDIENLKYNTPLLTNMIYT